MTGSWRFNSIRKMDSARLRHATAKDTPRVAGLLIEVRAAFMPYAPSVHTDDEVHAWVASHLIPSGGVVIAETHGTVGAAMHTERKRGASWITQIAVDPHCTRKGVGSMLLAHALRTMAPPVRAYTFQANLGARRFFERHGFIAIAFTDGQTNEERCPDVLYEFRAREVET
jgi:ribosomal protein S18 acetylase RimI-like enzyme